ncbi:MAG: DUF5076 domain-containing protein [Brevundimonas sp.]
MTAHKYALPQPHGIDQAPEDGSVLEVARVWINPAHPSIMVRPAYDDPRAMGKMLAELCWNFAEAYRQRGDQTREQALEALKAGWKEGHANGEANARRGSVQ